MRRLTLSDMDHGRILDILKKERGFELSEASNPFLPAKAKEQARRNAESAHELVELMMAAETL